MKFDSDVVREAAAEFEELMFTEGNVLGGREAIASTNFGTAGNPMFDAKPGCWMYKQGSFITGFFPEDIVADLDANVGVFGFPPAEAGGENPVLGGGDMAMLLNDSDNAKKVMGYLAETDIGNDAAPSSSLHLAAHGLRRLALPERAGPELRQGASRSPRASCSTAPTRCPARSVRAPSGRT